MEPGTVFGEREGNKRREHQPILCEEALSHPSELSTDHVGLIGDHPEMHRVFARIDQLADTEWPVLIQGETGTGKELVARALHQNSRRAHGPFVAVNCGALPENIVESELFGHEKGAFTGAVSAHAGKFEQASGGTLFLDEIGDLPLVMQVKLLRALDQGVIERLGSIRSLPVNVRLVSATNRNLDALVAQGVFRTDLYYRVDGVRIDLPPLRVRRSDIPLLVRHILGEDALRITPEAMQCLMAYNWPGNVRQLKNVAQQIATLCNSHAIDVAHLPEKILNPDGTPEKTKHRRVGRTELEDVLKRVGWNQTRAASVLGVNRKTVQRKIKRYGLQTAVKFLRKNPERDS